MRRGKIDRVDGMKADTSRHMHVNVPCNRRYDMARASHKLALLPIHEALDREVEEQPDLLERAAAKVSEGAWADNYRKHPLVNDGGSAPLPLVIYADGVPYSTTDSVVGFWVYNLVSERRHLVGCVKKRNLCKCGCKGWCGLYVICRFLVWCLDALAKQAFPSRGPFGEGFGDDHVRRALAGSPLRSRGAVVEIHGDWSEIATTFGLMGWQHVRRPCFCCTTDALRLYDLEAVNALDWRCELTSQEQYENACKRAEVWVWAEASDRDALIPLLVYSKKDKDAFGRCLVAPFPGLGLEKNDRLEPSHLLSDVGAFEELVFPTWVLFWRSSLTSWVKHRCPLLEPRLGLGIESFAIDTLHCLHLGVWLTIVRTLFWRLFSKDAWGVRGSAAEIVQVSVLRLRNEIVSWYKEPRVRKQCLTEITDLTAKMMGTAANPKLKVKAAECWSLVLFCPQLLATRGGALGAELPIWRDIVGGVIRHMNVMKEQPRNMSTSATQELVDTFHAVMQGCKRLEDYPFYPQNHMWGHMIQRSLRHGNPRLTASFLDEHYNGVLKKAARGLHGGHTFEGRLLTRMDYLMDKAAHKRQLKRRRSGSG